MGKFNRVSFLRLLLDRRRGKKEGMISPNCFDHSISEIDLSESNRFASYRSEINFHIKSLNEKISGLKKSIEHIEEEKLKYKDLLPKDLANNIFYSSLLALFILFIFSVCDAIGISWNIMNIFGDDDYILSLMIAIAWNAIMISVGHLLANTIENPKTKKIIVSFSIIFVIISAIGLSILRLPLLAQDVPSISDILRSGSLLMVSFILFMIGLTVVAPVLFGMLIQHNLKRLSHARISRKIHKTEAKLRTLLNDTQITVNALNSLLDDMPYNLQTRQELRKSAYRSGFNKGLHKRLKKTEQKTYSVSKVEK